MSSKNLTLEEKFRKYQDHEFYVRLHENKQNIKVNFTIVGYTKGDSSYLIGKLVKNQGVTGHFKNPHTHDHIEDNGKDSTYIYVHWKCLDKYPIVKNVKPRKSISGLDDLDDIELEFDF